MTTKNHHHTKPRQNGISKAGLIINCVISSISIFINSLFLLLAAFTSGAFLNNSLLANFKDTSGNVSIAWLVIAIIFMLAILTLNIFSLIISIRALRNKTKKLLLAGVLALFTGGLIAGVLILVGRSEQETYNNEH